MRTADSCVTLELLPGGLVLEVISAHLACVEPRLLRAHASIKRRRDRGVSNTVSMHGATISRQELCPEVIAGNGGPKLENGPAITDRVNTEPSSVGCYFRGVNTGAKACFLPA